MSEKDLNEGNNKNENGARTDVRCMEVGGGRCCDDRQGRLLGTDQESGIPPPKPKPKPMRGGSKGVPHVERVQAADRSGGAVVPSQARARTSPDVSVSVKQPAACSCSCSCSLTPQG